MSCSASTMVCGCNDSCCLHSERRLDTLSIEQHRAALLLCIQSVPVIKIEILENPSLASYLRTDTLYGH